MDITDKKIAALLAEDARRSLADIGEAVGLSASAVNERIRRLAASGVIKRFTVDADHALLGLAVTAFVLVGLDYDAGEEAFKAFAADHPSVAECHHVTGGWSYLLKVRVRDLAGLETFLAELKARRFLSRSETMIVLSTAVERGFTLAEV
ncbi:Lrp/AsnC family transcriptional regulator [Ciceribacter naphthalenivorans]|uniref:AsnC family transcriptional regulator n=3 Tax=Alphaproteobacteria TaxID=28211 RepID=A0A512HHQ9_9HYPH|nr:Lrp/AsnC family transcriptional regulator [Ciceribacter naphthalenivorans]GEO84979.1 AsnC family transcriptional regulator [Ciceribacter naphthalenivorans]GLR22913.1 AsnC family transcriptional regulator [Ciceribacter naphthalenivorans]GLT05769.1 AsnC family transcriptional regulator [Sphingomonas psychrolutea]